MSYVFNNKDKIVIGIDQSYTRTGVALVINGKVIKHKIIKFKGCKTKTDKRKAIGSFLYKILKSLSEGTSGPQDIMILCERIRTFSGKYGLRPDYLKSTGALIATIVDVAYDFGVKVYSVDTRAWKAQVVGSSKAKTKKIKVDGKIKEVRDAKTETLDYVENIVGIKCDGEDDLADAICIGLFPFKSKDPSKYLKEEK